MTRNTVKITSDMLPSLVNDQVLNSMWSGRAKTMISAIFSALDYIRGKESKQVTISDVEKYIQLGNLITLADKKTHPDMPESIRNTVKTYLNSLPRWDENKADLKDNLKEDKGQDMVRQHGFLEQMFVKSLGAVSA